MLLVTLYLVIVWIGCRLRDLLVLIHVRFQLMWGTEAKSLSCEVFCDDLSD